jgi:CDP-glucose 4,6-dehydratase
VASSLYKHLGHGEIETADSGTAVHEANLLQLNCDKANQVLNWQAKWSADEAVLKTSSWYGALLKGEDMARVTSRQINEYFGASDD